MPSTVHNFPDPNGWFDAGQILNGSVNFGSGGLQSLSASSQQHAVRLSQCWAIFDFARILAPKRLKRASGRVISQKSEQRVNRTLRRDRLTGASGKPGSVGHCEADTVQIALRRDSGNLARKP
jgi:hypothetical protein